jgi:hypothetical protein
LQNEVLNGKESEESMLKKQVDRLVKSPIKIAVNSSTSELDDSDPGGFEKEADKTVLKQPKKTVLKD